MIIIQIYNRHTYLWTKLFYGFSRWLYLFGVGMVVCVDGGGYYRYVWVCACYNRGLKFFFFFSFLTINFFYIFFSVFQFWSAFLECVFLKKKISGMSYLCFVWCFAVFILLLKECPHGDNKVVLYCIVLYCIVLYLAYHEHTHVYGSKLVLYCIGLDCIVLYWIGLDWIGLYCTVLYCTVSYLAYHEYTRIYDSKLGTTASWFWNV